MPRKMKDSGVEWIGEIPNNWEVRPLKAFLKNNDGGVWGNDPLGDENDKVVIRSTEQTVDGKWCIEKPAIRDLSGINYKEFQIVCGDLLLTKSSGSELHIGKTTIADEYFDTHECYYSNFIQRLRIREGLPKFFWYILNSIITRAQFAYLQNSTSGLGNINSSIIREVVVPNVPIKEQIRIVDFLDRKCAEIDSVISQTRASIEEYKKLKQAVITQAVTKGIRGDRPMKDSGSTWFTEIPDSWEMKRIKYIFRIKKDIAGKEGYTVLSITQKGVIPKNIASNGGQLAENYSNYQFLHPGQFAMNHMDLLTGWVDISSHDGVTSPDYRVFEFIRTDDYSPEYYLFLLQMCYKNRIFYGLGQGVSGMGRWRLQADKFLNFEIPVPSYEEQCEIAEYLSMKCGAIDELIASKQHLLAELENYKKSLIYEYVTGKKEVI